MEVDGAVALESDIMGSVHGVFALERVAEFNGTISLKLDIALDSVMESVRL